MTSVLHVSTVHSPFDPRIYQKEVRSLADAGYDMTLATTVDDAKTVDGVRFFPLGAAPPDGTRRLSRIPRNLRALRAMLGNYAIVHIHDPELLLASMVGVIAGRKVVYDVHEFYRERIADTNWIPKSLRPAVLRMYSFVERLVSKRLSGVVVVSPDMLPHYRQFLSADRVALVRNYPNITAAQVQEALVRGRPIEEPYIVHTGGASRHRAFDVMVEAAERLRALGCSAPLINVGTVDLSAYPANLQTELVERAKSAGIRQMGWCSYEDSLRWIAHAQAAYLPLALTANNLRGVPQKMFEYFRFGVPVVACAFGRVQEIVSEWNGGLLVDPSNAQEHANALYTLLEDPEQRERFAAGARNAGNTYAFSAEVPQLIGLYERILSKKPAAKTIAPGIKP